MIAMAHPCREFFAFVESGKHPIGLDDPYLGTSVLAPAGALHFRAFDPRDELHPVTDAEYRRDVEERGIGSRDVLAVNRIGAAAQNDPGRIPFADPLERARGRMNLGIHARLSNAARYELGVLCAVIEDEYPAGHRVSISTSSVSRSRSAAVQRPVSQPHASPGLTRSVFPRFTISSR